MDPKELRKYVGQTHFKPEISTATNQQQPKPKPKLDLSKAKGLIGLDRRASVPYEGLLDRRDSATFEGLGGRERRASMTSEEPGSPPMSPSAWVGSPPSHPFTQQAALMMLQPKQQKPMIFKQFDFK